MGGVMGPARARSLFPTGRWLGALALATMALGCVEDRVIHAAGYMAGGAGGAGAGGAGGNAGAAGQAGAGGAAGRGGSAGGGGMAGAGAAGGAGMAGRGGSGGVPGLGGSGGASSALCDMTGKWIEAEVTFSDALGARQTTVNWIYYDIVQRGDRFQAVKSLNCGLRVTGTTTVTLRDATMEALALKNSSSQGRQGTFKLAAGGGMCEFQLDRTYNLRGANWDQYMGNTWRIGDPPIPLSMFPALPPNEAAGMEDWDGDAVEGITLITSFGERYVAQRDWNEESGMVPTSATRFGGMGVVSVVWDGEEAVSEMTNLFLRTSSTPQSPGYSQWIKVDQDLTVVTTGAHPELETCKNVQRLALDRIPNP